MLSHRYWVRVRNVAFFFLSLSLCRCIYTILMKKNFEEKNKKNNVGVYGRACTTWKRSNVKLIEKLWFTKCKIQKKKKKMNSAALLFHWQTIFGMRSPRTHLYSLCSHCASLTHLGHGRHPTNFHFNIKIKTYFINNGIAYIISFFERFAWKRIPMHTIRFQFRQTAFIRCDWILEFKCI